MTRNERTLEFIGEWSVGRDEVEIFRWLNKTSSAEMRLFLQNLMAQGLLSNYDRRVEGSRIATIWQITAKGTQVLKGGHDHAGHAAAPKQFASHNCG